MIFTTSIILQGISLPIYNMIIDSNKINQRLINKNEFTNLIGRCGRNNQLSKINYGFVYIRKKPKMVKRK